MLRDAINVKKSMLKTLEPERAKKVSKAISRFYDDDIQDGSSDPAALKEEIMQGWSGLTLPKISNPFSSSGKESTENPTENTPLV